MCAPSKPEERFVGYFLSKSTYLLIGLAVVALIIIHLHPLTQSWAWTIAQTLITANGLILGFSVLGVTIVSERAFLPSRMSDILEKHLKKSTGGLRNIKPSEIERIHKSYSEAAKSAILEIKLVPNALFETMYFLFASLILAITLFGVSDSTVTSPALVAVFTTTMTGSLLLLVIGVNLTFRVLKELAVKTTSEDLLTAAKKAFQNVPEQEGTTHQSRQGQS